MSQDGLIGWSVFAVLALCVGGCVATGKIPGRYGTIRRSDAPRTFWVCIGIAGVFVFVLLFTALYFTLPPLPSS